MISLAIFLACLVQDPAAEAVTLARELRKGFESSSDTEVRLRLGEIVRRMSDRAGVSLCGEAEDPDQRTLRLYDIKNIVARTRDSRSGDFWRWARNEEAAVSLEEPREAMIGLEELLELIAEATGRDHWQAENTIEKTPSGQLLVNAPPFLQRRVARVVRTQQKESLAAVRISITLLASDRPLAFGADADGAITDEAWDRVCRQADEGGAVRRLGSVETVAHPEQTVASFSGVRRPVAMAMGENGPLPSTVPDGLALEASALPSGDRFSLRLRLAYTKVLGIEEVATNKGTLRLPRLAEAAFADLRNVASGRPVVLGTLGPLAPEAELPPHVVVVARLSWVRP